MSSCKSILSIGFLIVSILFFIGSSIISMIIYKLDYYAVFMISGYESNPGNTYISLESNNVLFEYQEEAEAPFTYIFVDSCINEYVLENSKCGNFTGFNGGLNEAETRVKAAIISNWFVIILPFVFILIQSIISISNHCCGKNHVKPTFLNTFFRLSTILITFASLFTFLLMSYGFDNNILKGTSGISFYFKSSVPSLLSGISFLLSAIGSILAFISFMLVLGKYRRNKLINHYYTI